MPDLFDLLVMFMRVERDSTLAGSDLKNLQDFPISARASGSGLKLAMTVGARFG